MSRERHTRLLSWLQRATYITLDICPLHKSLHTRSERVSEVHATQNDTTTTLKYKAPKDYTKPQQTIQSRNGPYEATANHTKPPNDYTKTCNSQILGNTANDTSRELTEYEAPVNGYANYKIRHLRLQTTYMNLQYGYSWTMNCIMNHYTDDPRGFLKSMLQSTTQQLDSNMKPLKTTRSLIIQYKAPTDHTRSYKAPERLYKDMQ